MSKKVSEDAKKALVSLRLVEIGLKHGVFVLVFDGPKEMDAAVEDMKLGADVRAAIEGSAKGSRTKGPRPRGIKEGEWEWQPGL